MSFFKGITDIKICIIVLVCMAYGEQSFAQTPKTNYMRVRIPQIPVTDTLQLDTIPIQRQSISIEYSDPLGRSQQSVQLQGSASLKDIIRPYAYDKLGRVIKSYLPYADESTSASTKGTYRTTALTKAVSFYSPASPGAPKIPTDVSPFSQMVYEASPLSRVVEMGDVGSVFQPGTGHSVKISYGVNKASDGIDYHGIQNDVLVAETAFAPGVLEKFIITDGNGHRQALWKDLQGRVVTKTQLDAPTPYYSTDYFYNDLNQLSIIITPPSKRALAMNGFFSQLAYIFHYDSVGRVVEKKAPGSGWQYTVYNHSNQPVLSQDSNMRVKNQWMYTKYDAEGRIVQTGIYINKTVTKRNALQHLCDTSFPVLWETWQPGTGYTNNAFPTQSAIPGAAPLTIYTTYYYDDYSFTEAAAKPFQTNSYNASPTLRTMGMLTGASVYVLGTTNQRMVTVNYYDKQNRLIQVQGDNHLGQVDVINNRYNFIGELLGHQRITTAIAGSPISVKDSFVFDHLGRLLDTYESFQGGAPIDISHNVYNEIGQKVSEGLNSTNYNLGNGRVAYTGTGPMPGTITENTTLTTGKTDIAGTSVTLNPSFSFTATSGNTYLAAIGYSFAQTQEFRYSIRGQLTNINNGTLTNDGITQTDPNALFGESITYSEASPLSATPQYNGNISGITWRNKIEQTGQSGVTTGGQGYSFTYDNVDRFKQSSYYTQSGGSFVKNTVGALTENISGYDEMGNIDSLKRKDKAGTYLNNLKYNYQPVGNQLISVSDAGSENISGTFTYDGNGNMTSDSKKGITITYNYLDLPDTVKQGSSKLVFTYDAAGNKLYKQLINSSGGVISQRHYVEDEEVVSNGSVLAVESIAMAEGRIVNAPGGYQYEYYLQDHLYTNRVAFTVNADGSLKFTQAQNYYPFGRDMGDNTMNYSSSPANYYKYSSKEIQPELNLNTYDFGARHYDPVLGRWTAVDPLAATSDDLSPYNYVENNPMNIIDPDGMQPDGLNPVQVPWLPCHSAAGGLGNGLTIGAGAIIQGVQAWNAFKFERPTMQNWNKLPSYLIKNYTPSPQATLSEWKPGFYDKWKSGGIAGKFTYDIVDQAYVAVWSVFWPVGEVRHLNGEYASAKDKQSSFVFTAASFIPVSKGAFVIKATLEEGAAKGVIKLAEKNIISRTGPGVYDLATTGGKYVGQSKNMLARLISHFSSAGKLSKTALLDDIFRSMPGSTQLQREVYEQYLVTKYGLSNLMNIVNPMGGRMKLYESMIENVIKTFNLPR